tara:strand:+ start:454 stop:897 length:444 start_codon:yes stop_codon:yes gene_type:complete
MSKKLTLKQQRFVDYYLQTGNATKSAKLAGYNATAQSYREIGHQNLTKVDIKSAIQNKLIKDKINPTYVLSGISTIADSSKRDNDKLRAYELLGKYLKLFTDTDQDKPTEIILRLGSNEPMQAIAHEQAQTIDKQAIDTPQLPNSTQ